jgi:hypothetical protein
MPATAPFIGHGLKFEYGDGATTEVFTELKGTTDVQFGSGKVDTLDSTTMGTTGNARTYQGGLEDPGDVTIKGDYLPGETTQTAMIGKKDGALHNFKVIYAGTIATESFAGIVVSFDKSVPLDKNAEFTCKIKISGPITIA